MTVRGAVGLCARDAATQRVLALAAVCGLALGILELLGPLLFTELAGSRSGGSGLFGVVMAGPRRPGSRGAGGVARRCTCHG